MRRVITSEQVSDGLPDKTCEQITDARHYDKATLVAVEVLSTSPLALPYPDYN